MKTIEIDTCTRVWERMVATVPDEVAEKIVQAAGRGDHDEVSALSNDIAADYDAEYSTLYETAEPILEDGRPLIDVRMSEEGE